MNLLQRIIKSIRERAQVLGGNHQFRIALKLLRQGQDAQKSGNLADALQHFEAAVAAAPQMSRARMNLGNVLLALKSIDKAFECYLTAVQLDPKCAPAHYNLGNGYWHKNQYDAALKSYLYSSDLDPKFELPWIAMANTLATLGRSDDAIDACKHALKISPKSAEAHVVMSMILHGTGQLEESISIMRAGVALCPDHPIALTNLANYLAHAFQFEESEACYRRASEYLPNDEDRRSSLLFLMSHNELIDCDSLFNEHVLIGTEFERRSIDARRPHTNEKQPNRKLRIGFVSADFRNHAVMHFVEPLFRKFFELEELETFAYYNHTTEDTSTNEFRPLVDHWRDVSRISDSDMDERIRSDRIDILFDLSGHTSGHRLILFARKPAPIQVSWIGYPGTTGMHSMDYYMADKHFLPQREFKSQFVEKLVYLPSTAPYLPYTMSPDIQSLPAMRRGYVTFGSFNRPSKIRRSVVALWSRTLRAIPRSRILLAGMLDKYQIGVLTKWFTEEGISIDRLTFNFRDSVIKYLDLHHDVDICLDTFPYTGGTTTRHALWMGVPTLTMAGNTPASRQASSILELMNLEEFVASSEIDFVQIAVNWSNRIEELETIRATMRDRYNSSILRNPDLIASAFAKATRIMWQRWCNGESTDVIDVSEYCGTQR